MSIQFNGNTGKEADAVEHHSSLDALNWPAGITAVGLWPFLNTLWEHAPTPTALYMLVSAAFMLFQMSDKLGLLDRFKRRPAVSGDEDGE